MDPFMVYGPYGSPIFDSFSKGLSDASNCYRLKSYNEDLSKNLKKLKKLNKLYVIDLKNNKVDSIPEDISTFQNLMYLKSVENKLKKLPETIGLCKTIKSLILHHVNIDSLPKGFKNLGSLTELEIQINHAENFDTQKELSGLYNLKSLMIYKTNLTAFPIGLDKNMKLKKILFVNCGLNQIDSSFALMNNVQSLILDKNNFKEFPKEIMRLKTLKELSLRNNKLTSLPEGISFIKGLEILDVTGNYIPPSEIHILRILLPHCKIIHN
jgi:Leucine-rich repeat (LRR) protein